MLAYIGGEAGAFRELFGRYSASLLGYMRRGLFRAEDAHELVHETFLHLHRARNDFRTDARLAPWLWTIAVNVKRAYMRSKGRRPEDLTEEGETPETPVAGHDAGQADEDQLVREAIDRLPDQQREVIWLHWFEGFSFPEIGELVGASTSAVKVRAHRGYERLRLVLGASLGRELLGGGE